MPSPIAHAAVGYLVYRKALKSRPAAPARKVFGIPVLLLSAMIFSLLPDLDSLVGVLMQDFGRFHNNGSHSLVIGLAAALLFGLVFSGGQRKRFFFWFFFVLAGYELHVIMDAFTYGRGVKAFWPFSEVRFLSPVFLFFGLHWSDGFFSFNHVITLVTETVFSVLLLAVFDRDSRELFNRFAQRAVRLFGTKP